jgi:hypothetical protein
MCGNPNPADAEVCIHCQAQLQPIIGGATPPESSPPPAEEKDEMDWLRNLASDDESPPADNVPKDDEPAPVDDSFLLNRINLSGASPAEEETPKQAEEPPAFSLPEDQEEEGNADWFAILEESSARKESAVHALPEEDNSGLDTWLDSLDKDNSPPPAAPESEKSKPPKSLTDRLREERMELEESKQGDWMNTLRNGSSDEAEDKSTPEPASPLSPFTSNSVDRTGSLMGWLDDKTPFSGDSKATNNADLPDWLNEETTKQESAEPILPDLPEEEGQPAQAADLPDWLQDMAPAEATPPAPSTMKPLGSADQDDSPSWLKDETDDTAADMLGFSAGNGDEMSDLLSDFQEEEKPAEEAPAVPAEDIFTLNTEEKESSPFPFGGDLPVEKDDSFEEDSLIGMASPDKDKISSEDSSPLKSIPLGNGEDLPDWLSEISPSAAADESLADKSLAGESPVDEPPAAEAAAFDVPPFTDETSTSSAPIDSNLPFGDDADLPDWLTSDQPPAKEEAGTGEDAPAVDVPAFSSSPFLDNLAAEEESPFEKETSIEEPGPVAEEETVAMDIEPAPTGDEHPLAADLPDWLESEEASTIMPEQLAADETAEDLSPAQLPGWLAAMRPVESVAAESDGDLNQHIEKSGPLAGLRGVLPVDRQSIKYRKPPVYSVKLKVTETQAQHAGLMEDLLEREHKPSEARRVGTQGSKRLMQLVVALVLIVVLIIFRGAGNISDLPGRPYLSPFVTSFFNEIESLESGSPVLLAVDYEPGYSGELKAASNATIQRLMSKDQRIAVISTVPAGPALAEDLLRQAYLGLNTVDQNYTLNTHTINLGYMPGGLTSLKEFSLRPKQAARYGLTTEHDGLIPWNHPTLAGVNTLTDFAAVIVVTDSVESGRAWVEQVQPSLGSTPMLLISSAQSAPIMEAYVQSGQLSGMLSGLAGSVSYEKLLQQPGTGHTYWIALQGGLAVVVALTLVGILLKLFVTLAASRRTQSED